MRVGLVLHGPEPGPRVLAALRACDALVCADGGANAVLRAGLAPRLVVGDLDSFDPSLRALAEQRGARFVRYPEEKDETDGERALEEALALRPKALVLAGALGGRTAMALANLQLLRRCHGRGLDAEAVEERETARYLGSGEVFDLAPWEGGTLNVLPVEPAARVSIEGVAFPLARAVLAAGHARGVSNRVLRPDARIVVHEGLVLLILETPEESP